MTKLKKHQTYFYVFLGLSILGLMDIATRQSVAIQHKLSDTGIISLYVGKIFATFSASIAGIVIVSLSFIFSFTILWIAIAIVEYFTIKKINKKEEKQLK